MKPLTAYQIYRFQSLLPESTSNELVRLPLNKVCPALDHLYSTAMVYLEQKFIEKAFTYFLRFVDATVDKLPKHPDYNVIAIHYKATLCRRTIRAISIAEKLKSEILKSYCQQSM